MGLVQRAIESAGVSTVTLSPIPEFTASVGAPRVAAIEYPPGRPFGQPGDAAGQQEVLLAALRAAAEMAEPGRVDLPFRWPEKRPHWHPPTRPPIAQLLLRKPWLYSRLVAGKIPA